MRESKFTGLLKNVTDNAYLKDVIQTGHIGGEPHSNRIKPLYRDYLGGFR